MLPRIIAAQYLKEWTFKVLLYGDHARNLSTLKKLSSGMAASLVGIDRVSFLLSLHHYGVDMIDFEFDELKDDIANA